MDEPPIPYHPLRAQAEADLSRVIQEIVSLTGLPARWNGSVAVRGMDFAHSGQKHSLCLITLREDTLTSWEQRWTTMIHEGLHSVSGTFSAKRLDPTQNRWEEGVAEQVQRLIRDDVLQTLGVSLDAEVIRGLDARHRYNQHIRSLEIYRVAARRQPRDFYLELLRSTPIERSRLLVTALRASAERREEER
jgi:hypothetical protein